MSRGRNLKEHDLPISMVGAATLVNVTGGGGGGNADTVDGYHAAAVPTPGYLLALNALVQFPTSVLDWSSVAGVGLQESPADKLAIKLDTSSGLAVSASGIKLDFSGGNPTSIQPDASASAGSQPYAARADHRHAIVAAAPSSNLSVTSPNAEGSATSFARSDHSHAITSSSNPGAAASILASSAQGYLQLVRLGLGVAPSYPLHIQGTTPQLRLQQDAGNYADFEVDGGGDLSLKPSGDSLLVPGTKTLASHDWASQTTGWAIYPESTYGRSGYADFRYIYADELHVKAFVTDLEQALAGGQIISKSVAIIAEDFTIPAKGDGAVLTVEDLPGTTAWAFANGDWVRVRNISRSGGGLVVADAYGTVTQVSQNGDGTQTYAFWRPAGDTGSAAAGTVIKKGGLVLDYGTSGSGYWEVTAIDPAGSPYAQVVTWATHPQNLTVHTRLGNLDGIAGIGAEWGLWAGKDVNHYVKVSSGGAELKGLAQTWIDASGNTRGVVDPSAGTNDYLFWLGPSSGDKRFAVTGAGTVYIGNVPAQNIAGWAYAGDLTKIDGGDIYAGTVTAQAMTVTMANVIDNPGFESGTTGWILNPGASGSAGGRSGPGRLTGDGNRADGYAYAEQRIYGIRAEEMYYVECWCWCSGGVRNTGVQISWRDASGADIGSSYCRGDTGGVWTRHSALVQAPSNTSYAIITCRQWGTPNAAAPRWDDLVMRPASGANLVVGTPGSARVEINNTGIEGYSDATTKQFYLRTSDGRAMFGGGEGVLDKSGLVLSGNETSYNTYNAVRWMMETDPPGGNEVARIAAGRLYNFSPMMQIDVNRISEYANSVIEATARGSASSARLRIGGYSGSSGASLSASHSTSGTAEWSVDSAVGSSPRARGVINDTAVLTVSSGLVRVDGFLYVASTVVAESRVGIGYSANPPSYPLHIAKSDLVGIHIVHEATSINRALVVTRRNAANNATLEWYQEFSAGDSPSWSLTRVNRPDGSGAGFLTALNIGWNGDVTAAGTLSAGGNVNCAGAYFVNGTRVVYGRYISGYFNNEPQSTWSSASWDLLRAIRDCLIHHGLAAAS